MALNVAAASASSGRLRIVFTNSSPTQLFSNLPLRPTPLRTLHVTSAKKFTSRTGRFDSKNRRSAVTTKDQDVDQSGRTPEISEGDSVVGNIGVGLSEDGAASIDVSGLPSDLPGTQPDFWEGPQWDALGFFVQYMWAFGIVFSLIACGIAVATYNEGASDFKQTPAYKESMQSRDLLEEPEASNSDVFESNPTEVAPSLE